MSSSHNPRPPPVLPDNQPLTCIIEGRVCRQHSTYTCQFYSAHQRTVPALEGKHWYRVRSVEPAGFDTVYNIEVEDDHSYIAEGIVVHNCQDVSIAGKQAGLHEGKRSSLFFEAIRIIQEMRCATHGKYPKFAVFENVPGLFSSARGADFRAVLQAFIGICDDSILVPEPPKGKWLHAGEIMGDHYSLAWRV